VSALQSRFKYEKNLKLSDKMRAGAIILDAVIYMAGIALAITVLSKYGPEHWPLDQKIRSQTSDCLELAKRDLDVPQGVLNDFEEGTCRGLAVMSRRFTLDSKDIGLTIPGAAFIATCIRNIPSDVKSADKFCKDLQKKVIAK
jgi:hypothetical protein